MNFWREFQIDLICPLSDGHVEFFLGSAKFQSSDIFLTVVVVAVHCVVVAVHCVVVAVHCVGVTVDDDVVAAAHCAVVEGFVVVEVDCVVAVHDVGVGASVVDEFFGVAPWADGGVQVEGLDRSAGHCFDDVASGKVAHKLKKARHHLREFRWQYRTRGKTGGCCRIPDSKIRFEDDSNFGQSLKGAKIVLSHVRISGLNNLDCLQ